MEPLRSKPKRIPTALVKLPRSEARSLETRTRFINPHVNALSLEMALSSLFAYSFRTVDDSQCRSDVHRRESSRVAMVNHVGILGNESRAVLCHLFIDLHVLSSTGYDNRTSSAIV